MNPLCEQDSVSICGKGFEKTGKRCYKFGKGTEKISLVIRWTLNCFVLAFVLKIGPGLLKQIKNVNKQELPESRKEIK